MEIVKKEDNTTILVKSSMKSFKCNTESKMMDHLRWPIAVGSQIFPKITRRRNVVVSRARSTEKWRVITRHPNSTKNEI